MIIARNKSLVVSDIRVPEDFLENPPRTAKWNRYAEQYQETGKLPKVYVDAKMNLVDGYIPYLIALHNDVKRIRGVVLYVRKRSDPQPIEEIPEPEVEAPAEPAPQPYGFRLGKLHITVAREGYRHERFRLREHAEEAAGPQL